MDDHFGNISLAGLWVWHGQAVPAFWFQRAVIEIHNLAVFGVGGEAMGVRVGDLILLYFARLRMINGQGVTIKSVFKVVTSLI